MNDPSFFAVLETDLAIKAVNTAPAVYSTFRLLGEASCAAPALGESVATAFVLCAVARIANIRNRCRGPT